MNSCRLLDYHSLNYTSAGLSREHIGNEASPIHSVLEKGQPQLSCPGSSHLQVLHQALLGVSCSGGMFGCHINSFLALVCYLE